MPRINFQANVKWMLIFFFNLINTRIAIMNTDRNDPVSEPATPKGIGPTSRKVATKLISAGSQLILLNSRIFCLPRKMPDVYVLYKENGIAINTRNTCMKVKSCFVKYSIRMKQVE